jgi:hypothetical protein
MGGLLYTQHHDSDVVTSRSCYTIKALMWVRRDLDAPLVRQDAGNEMKVTKEPFPISRLQGHVRLEVENDEDDLVQKKEVAT